MTDVDYEFIDLDSDASFQLLGKSLGGVFQNNSLLLDNHIAKGDLIKSFPEKGLCLRKWKFTLFQKIMMHKMAAPARKAKKFSLIYFLNPAIFLVKNKGKKIHINSLRNNMFMSGNVSMDFSVNPKQPFYVLDVTFTASWLAEQFSDADTSFKNILDGYINKNTETIIVEPCCIEEYQTLHELDVSMLADNEDVLFIRSRAYNLVVSFFSKVINRKEAELIKRTVHYEQMIQAKMLMMENMQKPPKIEAIARKVNMSVSSLLRQFKLMFGKSVYEYYMERKMGLAKKMLLQNKATVKEIAETLGYKQASPFIETFTKLHGYSPGALKLVSDKVLFS